MESMVQVSSMGSSLKMNCQQIAGFALLTAVIMKSYIFWNMTP
jgi:hypothetical protein